MTLPPSLPPSLFLESEARFSSFSLRSFFLPSFRIEGTNERTIRSLSSRSTLESREELRRLSVHSARRSFDAPQIEREGNKGPRDGYSVIQVANMSE